MNDIQKYYYYIATKNFYPQIKSTDNNNINTNYTTNPCSI